MGKIDDSCRNVVNRLEGAAACGVVDLSTGALLGVHNSAAYPPTLDEAVATATMELFRGGGVARVEEMVLQHRGVPEGGAQHFEEVHISSKHNYHFAKTIANGKAVVVLVTRKTTNIGMGWAQLKSVIAEIEPLVA